MCAAVAEMSAGLVDAELGGNVYKKRVPMPGRGKSERDTVDDRELVALQRTAESLLGMDVESLGQALQAGELTEIRDEEEPHTG